MTDALRSFPVEPVWTVLSFGGLPRRFNVGWSGVGMLDGKIEAVSGSATSLMLGGLTVPSSLRFLEGESGADLSSAMGSAAIDDRIDDIPVLVADSDRRHVPTAA